MLIILCTFYALTLGVIFYLINLQRMQIENLSLHQKLLNNDEDYEFKNSYNLQRNSQSVSFLKTSPINTRMDYTIDSVTGDNLNLCRNNSSDELIDQNTSHSMEVSEYPIKNINDIVSQHESNTSSSNEVITTKDSSCEINNVNNIIYGF
jgi:hypothetical protein